MDLKKEKQKRVKRYPYICAVTAFFCWLTYGSYYVNDHFFVIAAEQFPDSLVGQLSAAPAFDLLGKLLYIPWLFGMFVTAAMCCTVYLIVDLLEIKGYFCILLAAGTVVVNRTFFAAHLYWPHEAAFSLFGVMFSLWVWKRKWMGIVRKFLVCVLSLTVAGLCSRAWMAMIPFAAGILLLIDLLNKKNVLMILMDNLMCFLIFGGWFFARQALPYLLSCCCGVEIMTLAGGMQAGAIPSLSGDAGIELLLRVTFFAAALLLLCMVQRRRLWFNRTPRILVAVLLLVQLFAVGMLLWNGDDSECRMSIMQLATVLAISLLDHSKIGRNEDITLQEWLETLTLRVKYGYQVGLSEEDNAHRKGAYEAPLGLWNWKRILPYKLVSFIAFWGLCAFAGVKLMLQQALPFWVFAAALVCFFLINRWEIKITDEICELNPYDTERPHVMNVFFERQLGLILTVLLSAVMIFNIVLANCAYF